jgi:hypothetical protein
VPRFFQYVATSMPNQSTGTVFAQPSRQPPNLPRRQDQTLLLGSNTRVQARFKCPGGG